MTNQEDIVANTLPTRLRAMRKFQGLTIKRVADGVGLAIPTISEFETGKVRPSIKTLNRIVKFYQYDLSTFFKGLEI